MTIDIPINIYDKTNINELKLDNNSISQGLYEYFRQLIENGVNFYIKNINVETKILEVDNVLLPLIIADKNYDDSYYTSFYSNYIGYVLKNLTATSFFTNCFKSFLELCGHILKKVEANKIIYVNHWLLSTNLHSKLTKEQIELITDFLKKEYPEHAIIFKSITQRFSPELFDNLKTNTYRMIASRQVFIMDREARRAISKKQRAKIKKDKKLMENTKYYFSESINENDFERIADIYRQLYITKYSIYNPYYTGEFFKLLKDNPLFNLQILRTEESIDGMILTFSIGKQTTAPAIGYQINKMPETALYRMLIAKLATDSKEYNLDFNMSAGVGDFKKQRGAIAETEYSAIYFGHLPLCRKFVYIIVQKIVNNIVIPIFKRYKLCGFLQEHN